MSCARARISVAWCCFLKSTFSAWAAASPLTAVLDNLEGRTRLYWTVTGGAGMLRQSGDSKTAAEEYSEALREKLFSYLDG